jgi:hypothetical protein
MKLEDILEYNDPETKKRMMDIAMRNIEDSARKQAGWEKRANDPERKAEMSKAHVQHDAKVESMKKIIADVAKKYSGDQFEAFASEVHSIIPASELKGMVDLRWAFDTYNPDRSRASGASWAAYGDARGRGDPSVVGKDGWTGD